MNLAVPQFILRSPVFVLLTLPAGIAVVIGLLPIPIAVVEKHFIPDYIFHAIAVDLDASGARSILSTIASSSMTALSLAYSLVLVVFTLAAGNIGPRLLKRFASELVNQVTAGILGGTFLYALLGMYLVTDDFVPSLVVMIGLVLAVLSVMQLIYFVRNVSRNVSVDDEVAKITQQVRAGLRRQHERGQEKKELPEESDISEEVSSGEAGYLGFVDSEGLCEFATENDIVVRIAQPTGTFLLADTVLFKVLGELEEEKREKLLSYVSIDAARTEDDSAIFSVNLLVEIGLRALSPGVNDTFTALAVVDNLSNVFWEMGSRTTYPAVQCDEEGKPRVILSGLTIWQLAGQAYHPLRAETATNALMARGLAKAFARLYSSGSDELKKVVAEHAKLLLQEVESGSHVEHDVKAIQHCLPVELRPK